MGILSTYTFCALSSLAFLAPLNAAEMAPMPVALAADENPLTVDETITQGQECTIQYTNANMANQLITVDIDNGLPGGETQQVQIQLDENGAGSGTWTPPSNWSSAVFKAPNSNAVSRSL